VDTKYLTEKRIRLDIGKHKSARVKVKCKFNLLYVVLL